MKSLKSVLLMAMLSGIFQCLVMIGIIASIVKQDPSFLFISILPFFVAIMSWGISYDRAVELRAWINPTEEAKFKNEIPQDAIDVKWIKEIEEAYGKYIQQAWSSDPLSLVKTTIANEEKDMSIRLLIASAKTATSIRLPK